jgi:hypothetical protein
VQSPVVSAAYQPPGWCRAIPRSSFPAGCGLERPPTSGLVRGEGPPSTVPVKGRLGTETIYGVSRT